MNVLVTAASRNGATAEIAQAIATALRSKGLTATVEAPESVRDIRGYDAVVLGSAVYAGHWLPAATGFVDRFGSDLGARPVWLFSSGPVGDPSRKLVQKMGADPVDLAGIRTRTSTRGHAIFPGKLAFEHATLGQRLALRIFRGLEGDFRDWARIDQWANDIATDLVRVDPKPSQRLRGVA
jgi:menaquinone-dependent protoporphyrinogen oxidase